MNLELHNSQIAELLQSVAIPDHAIFLGDQVYALPTEDWIRNAFARQFESILNQTGFTYRTEQRDCENFALWAAAWANHFHAETPGAPEAGLAFGELWIGTQEHAMNFAVHRSDIKQIYLAVYEPQRSEGGWSFNGRKLSPVDWKSVWLCKA